MNRTLRVMVNATALAAVVFGTSLGAAASASAACGPYTAYAPPGVYGKTSTASCGSIGLTTDTELTYSWYTDGEPACVRVRKGNNAFTSGGCAVIGSKKVLWGNVASVKALNATTGAILGTIVRWN